MFLEFFGQKCPIFDGYEATAPPVIERNFIPALVGPGTNTIGLVDVAVLPGTQGKSSSLLGGPGMMTSGLVAARMVPGAEPLCLEGPAAEPRRTSRRKKSLTSTHP